jgi:hypothetical protein
MKYIFLLLLAFLTFSPAQADAVWFSSSWNYKVKVEVNPNKVGTTTAVTSVPVYLDLAGMPASFWTNASSTGADIRVLESDEATETAFEIVSFATTTKRGELHFMADALATTSTSTFYIYYGNATATSYAVGATYGRNAVWSGYKAVYHLEGTTDYTGNSYTLTNTGSVPFNSSLLTNGGDFTPQDSLNNNSVLATTSYPKRFSALVKFDSVAGDERTIISQSDGSIHYYTLKLRDSDNHIVFRSNNATLAADVDTGVVATTGTWYFVSFVQHSNVSISIYVNATKTNTTATTYIATVSQLYFGYLGRSNVWRHDGLLDEIRVSNGASNDSVIWTEYNNIMSTSTFFYIGAEEAYSAGTSTVASTTDSIIWFE